MEWALLSLGGLLGSAHCVGMCGGFVLALGSQGHRWSYRLGRQLLYGFGRVFTYATGGVIAGYAGWRLASEVHTLLNVQAILALVAGMLLILQGLAVLGVFPGRKSSPNAPCLVPSLFGVLLRESRLRHVFLGGVINGLLPCGLVYAYLALAASSGGPLHGGLTMGLFGLGTIPVLAILGFNAPVLGRVARKAILVAAICVVLTGGLAIFRGVSVLRDASRNDTNCIEPHCPLCGP